MAAAVADPQATVLGNLNVALASGADDPSFGVILIDRERCLVVKVLGVRNPAAPAALVERALFPSTRKRPPAPINAYPIPRASAAQGLATASGAVFDGDHRAVRRVLLHRSTAARAILVGSCAKTPAVRTSVTQFMPL